MTTNSLLNAAHRSRHCRLLRPGMYSATFIQLAVPNLCTASTSCYVNHHDTPYISYDKKSKGKGFPYSIPSVGPGADPGVQAVSPQVTVNHPPGGRLPLLSARPAVTSPASEHHRPLAGTKLYCLVTEAHRCKQLGQGCYAALPRAGFELVTC